MAQRLIELYVSKPTEEVAEVLEDHSLHGIWSDPQDAELNQIRILVDRERTESVMDALEAEYSQREEFRLLVTEVAATLPRPEPEEEEEEDGEAETPTDGEEDEGDEETSRISREELYQQMTEFVAPGYHYLILVGLSSLVAAVGLMRGDVAIIVGAMVIAPLIGPNMSLALATTLGDLELAFRSIKRNLAGLGLALGLSLLIGLFVPFDPGAEQIMSRTAITMGDIVLALSAGAAGAIAVSTGTAAALIGVMVAVALLPPLVAFGLLIGAGDLSSALGAGLLVANNVIAINLAAVVVFILQGFRPRKYWDQERADRATVIALSIWFGLLAVLLGLITFFD